MKYQDEREEVCAYGREMEDRDLTIHTSGNVSRRVEEGVLITPSNTPYHSIQPEHVLLMDLEGNVLEGDTMPSVEHRVHLAWYNFPAEVQGRRQPHPPL